MLSIRKIISLVIILLMAQMLEGQEWQYTGGNAYYNSGNVGIGTMTPSANLDIYTNGVNLPTIRFLDGDITIPNYSTMGINPVLSSNTIGHIGAFQGAAGGFSFGGFSNSTDSRAMGIMGYSGKTAVDMPVVIFRAAKHNGATSFTSLAATEPAFDFTNSSTSIVRILGNGNLGIGTTTPSQKLDVNGNIKATGFILPSGAAVGKVLTSDANGNATWQTANGSASGWALNGSTVGTIKSIGTVDNYDLPIITNNIERMRILAGGGIAIGTASLPALDAKLAVKGIIYSQKVKVTQTGWADYVFDVSYRLRPLPEVERYIQQHHHLPEVPSAAEVEKNGLDLGDNQAILLKKIEELTLYIIDQNKRLEDQDRRSEQQQREIDALRKLVQKAQ